jgi:phospholipase/lecithinase/hemolysin
MRNLSVRKTLLAIILALALVLPSVAAASQFTQIVVFGDSLSDDGNLFALDPGKVPAAKYYQGRFSNGLVWVEYLAGADLLNADLVNNAYGGATTDGSSPPGLGLQVAAYTATAAAQPDTLYIIWIGANDFLGGASEFRASAANIETALEDLANFGAIHILVVDLPDLGTIPRNSGDANTAQVATALTQGFNAELADVVAEFRTTHPGVKVYEFSAFDLFADVIADPDDYDIGNTSAICPNFIVDDDFDNPDRYLFWDDLHPTTEAHAEIAKAAARVLPGDDDDDDGGSAMGCFIHGLRP